MNQSVLPYRTIKHTRSLSDSNVLSHNEEDKKLPNCKPRFLDDGGSSIIVATGGHEYPKRQRGQSLIDYLMSNQSNKICPELDRENAHFSVSEAMIAAIEETRFHEWKSRREEEEDEILISYDLDAESDEEVRQIKMELHARTFSCDVSSGTRKIYVPNTTIDTSISPESSLCTITPSLSPSYSLTSVVAIDANIEMKKVDHVLQTQDSGVSFTSLCTAMEKERRKSRKLARLKRVRSRLIPRPFSSSSSESTSMSTTPLSNHHPRALFNSNRFNSPPALTCFMTGNSSESTVSTCESMASAENVALSLLGHFSQLHLPHESDMEWLVSEKDAPQHLLPMPKSWPVNPDEPFMQLKENEIDDVQMTSLRGNEEWAPPRPQIVFAVYSSPNLKVVMAKQNYRCAGCGMKVEPEYSHSFRYCHYLGRYFCTACHSNKTFIIPSLIFKKWDFKKYSVSNFSFDLLERMWFDSLFRLGYINPLLYRRCRQLNKVLELRLQLVHVTEFLRICRYATEVWDDFRKQAADWLDDPEIYSLYDLTRVNSGELFQLLRVIVERGIDHVTHCELCSARGFLCEKCHASQVIFPFQFESVIRCEKCGSCYHLSCWNSVSCPKCLRKAQRLNDKREIPNS